MSVVLVHGAMCVVGVAVVVVARDGFGGVVTVHIGAGVPRQLLL